MRRPRFIFLVMLLIISVPSVCGWTLNNVSINPAGLELPPGTPVTAGYSIHFDSWMTGSTFEKDNTLIMYTDLADPHWTTTKVEPMENQPSIVEPLPVRQGQQIRLDGWALSYSSKRYDLFVQLTGKTPALNQTTTIAVVKLQENDGNAKTVAGSVIKKEIKVIVPTIAPTPAPAEVTINMTPAEIIEVTPEQKNPVASETPAKKVTYSPGPEPLLVIGLMVGLLLVAQYRTGRK